MALTTPKLKVTQIRGVIGRPGTQRKTLKGLGLRGRHSSVIVENTPAMRGMIKKVIHLVKIEDVNE
jgi:large subunit ribosomal protein L30